MLPRGPRCCDYSSLLIRVISVRSHSERDSKSVELVVRERDMLVMCVCLCAPGLSCVCVGGIWLLSRARPRRGTQPSLTNPPTRSLARERACDREADANEQQQQQQQRGEQAKTHLGSASTNTSPRSISEIFTLPPLGAQDHPGRSRDPGVWTGP